MERPHGVPWHGFRLSRPTSRLPPGGDDGPASLRDGGTTRRRKDISTSNWKRLSPWAPDIFASLFSSGLPLASRTGTCKQAVRLDGSERGREGMALLQNEAEHARGRSFARSRDGRVLQPPVGGETDHVTPPGRRSRTWHSHSLHLSVSGRGTGATGARGRNGFPVTWKTAAKDSFFWTWSGGSASLVRLS